jgi:hypothetical protein
MAEASGFTAVGLSGTDDALLIAAGVSSLPVSPALRAKRGIAATLMLSNTAANNRISLFAATLLRIIAFHFLLKMKSWDWFSSMNLYWNSVVLSRFPRAFAQEHLVV